MRSLLTAAVLSVAFAAPVMAQQATIPSINVSGHGEVTAPADLATAYIAIDHSAEGQGAALDMVSEAMTSVLAVLEAAGIDRSDIGTNRINLSPKYAQNVLGNVDYTKVVGYSASTAISVKVRDLNSLGGLLSDVVAGGATGIDNVFFSIADDDALMDEARRLAVADARHKAEVYADAAGVTLGPVNLLSDLSNGVMPVMVAEATLRIGGDYAEPKVDVPLVASDITVSVDVTMSMGIAQ